MRRLQIKKSCGILKRDRPRLVGAEEREDKTMKIMAVDFGDSRTGIAICDKGELLASPVCVIEEKHFPTTVKKTAEQAQEQGAEQIVVGHPLNMDGSKGPRAQLCEEFAQQLRELVEVPVVLWDERQTTVSAIGFLNETNTRGKKRKQVIDAVAATIILENYLNYRRNHQEEE